MDHRRVLVRGGHGGNGVSCFHSEPRKEFGGPDGGDGGNGGHVILRGRCHRAAGEVHCVCHLWMGSLHLLALTGISIQNPCVDIILLNYVDVHI